MILLGKYFETALAKWTAKNFKEGKPDNPNPPPPYSHQKEFLLIQNNSGGEYIAHNRRPLRFYVKMKPVVCVVDGQGFELPESTVDERVKQFGDQTKWLCRLHLTDENMAKYFVPQK